ncbi:GTPase [Pseudoalteromonas sp. MEBiC 03485]|uniref:dCTP deaminase domain-containing protein n=1 Tax=Pseudoalteromonas sp. MEBiC 03485 TaxID=2571103 RepID=UPI001459FFF2|nr:GTPase [Pseudoalteromonas sp. MEBiC 03485]
MSLLVFIVGVRGAGKSTLINKLKGSKNNIKALKPSTTRKPRGKDDDEYHFTSDWIESDYAWSIELGQEKYGMLNSELDTDTTYRVTVFDPGEIEKLVTFRNRYEGQTLTIGLDTVNSIKQQKQRVQDKSRELSELEFKAQREVVKNCDVLLSGDKDNVFEATEAIFECLASRGGVIPKSILSRMLLGNSLLNNTTNKISPASYDLRLGTDHWCQGEFCKLTDENPVLKIPPYSYAIVSSVETACLPSFITARFDLKNSLFFQGVILSNGPQIDPGYRGALFCMLYNGSDVPVGISEGDHFATIEFVTTAGLDLGYRDKYQGKTKLKDFMPSTVAVSKGGQILERTKEKIDKIESEWKNFRTILFALLALIFSPALIVYFNVYDIHKKWDYSDTELTNRLDELKVLEENVKKHIGTLQKLEKSIDEKMQSLDKKDYEPPQATEKKQLKSENESSIQDAEAKS